MTSKSKTILDFFGKPSNSKSPGSSKSPLSNGTSPFGRAVSNAISPGDGKKQDKQNFAINGSKPCSPKSCVSQVSTPRSSKTTTRKTSKRSLGEDENFSSNVDDEEEVSKPKRKRILIASESEDSEDEYKPGKDEESEDDEESIPSDASEEGSPTPKKKKLSKEVSLIASFKNPKASPSASKLNSPSVSSPREPKVSCESPTSASPGRTPKSKGKPPSSDTPAKDSEETASHLEYVKEWTHETLDWLRDDKLKDKYGRRKSDPEYNPRTLYVPENFKKNLTPAMKQWWDLKTDHFDTILFFKVGKFYELYHMDAVVGVKELGLTYMKGDFAHSGFPEIAYGRFSDVLVERGYKVARVEQTETPQMMEERVKKLSRPTKFDKVVSREICQITTKGTRMLNYQDEGIGSNNNYLLAVCEKSKPESNLETEYGICFIDTSIGKFTLSQFQDDRHGSRLLTMIALYPPVEILYERSSVSKKTLQLLSNNLNNVPREALASSSQFWDSSKTLKFLGEEGYFKGDNDDIVWPEILKNMLDPDDILHQTAVKQYELAVKSLGACIWYLKDCCIEDNLLSMKLFEEYKPLDGAQKKRSSQRSFTKQHMVLDGVTLRNLEIVPLTPSDKSGETLMGTVDLCSTSFGKRLLRHWLCSPLCDPDSISDRQDAVEDLIAIPEVADEVSLKLKSMPDLERLLSKIHTQGLAKSKKHPESRAVFYEADIYNKRKLKDFLSTCDGFKDSIKVVNMFQNHAGDFKSKLLRQCVTFVKDEGKFPDMSDALDYFDQAFDHEIAQKEGNIIPSSGVDEEYDAAMLELKQVEADLETYLNEMKKKLNCRVSYVGSGRTRFQLEVPDNRKVPDNFEFQGARKGFQRYYTPEGRKFLARITAAEESRDSALRDVARRIFAHFDHNYQMWQNAVHCISVLDVLLAFCKYYKSSEVEVCRPQFSLPDGDSEPFLEIVNGRHPTFLKFFIGTSYIPNSVYVGCKREEHSDEEINEGGQVVLVTGPNMGGKSTLMRQAGTLVIMAQVGCFVPAESMKLTPVDRIFTRVGANDQISKGESTFFVEASETSCILHHATPDSLVLIDELGRGTSTHDGTAIAFSVLKYLASDIGCRTLFSTHYHSLVNDFQTYPNVGFGHMSCMVEKDEDSPDLERITFLYKFVNGSCPKSYGFNVALLAGISKEIIEKGVVKARELENKRNISFYLKKLLDKMPPEELTKRVREKMESLNITV